MWEHYQWTKIKTQYSTLFVFVEKLLRRSKLDHIHHIKDHDRLSPNHKRAHISINPTMLDGFLSATATNISPHVSASARHITKGGVNGISSFQANILGPIPIHSVILATGGQHTYSFLNLSPQSSEGPQCAPNRKSVTYESALPFDVNPCASDLDLSLPPKWWLLPTAASYPSHFMLPKSKRPSTSLGHDRRSPLEECEWPTSPDWWNQE